MAQPAESDELFTRRLEAFSDIVMGFSLAQLGVVLGVTNRNVAFFSDPTLLISFLFPFAIICSMWFFHHRLFSYVFVPRTWPVLLNFVWLAAVVLLVLGAESYIRASSVTTTRFYFAMYAFVCALLGVQYLLAIRYAREEQRPLRRLRSERGAVFMFLWTVPCLLALLVVYVFPPGPFYSLIFVPFFIAGIISGPLARRYGAVERKLAGT